MPAAFSAPQVMVLKSCCVTNLLPPASVLHARSRLFTRVFTAGWDPLGRRFSTKPSARTSIVDGAPGGKYVSGRLCCAAREFTESTCMRRIVRACSGELVDTPLLPDAGLKLKLGGLLN